MHEPRASGENRIDNGSRCSYQNKSTVKSVVMAALFVFAFVVFRFGGVSERSFKEQPASGTGELVPSTVNAGVATMVSQEDLGHAQRSTGTPTPRRPLSQTCPSMDKDAVLFLIRPSVATSSRFLHKLTALRQSCKFIRTRMIFLLVAGEPNESLDMNAMNQAVCPHGLCKTQAIDVTREFWGGRPKDWETIRFKAHPTTGDAGGEKYPTWAKKTFSWGYRAMCDFWSRGVFEVSAVAELRFYLRMDDDSLMNCEQSGELDPFEIMERRGYDYGYYKFVFDIVPSHEQWVAAFIANHSGANVQHPVSVDVNDRLPYQDRGIYHVPSFYNNFEIVRVAYFRSKPVRNFNNAVAASRGIWEYRWGDAVQRYFQLALFEQNFTAAVWCVPTSADPKNSSGAIYYRHGRHVATCAIGEGATRWGPRG